MQNTASVTKQCEVRNKWGRSVRFRYVLTGKKVNVVPITSIAFGIKKWKYNDTRGKNTRETFVVKDFPKAKLHQNNEFFGLLRVNILSRRKYLIFNIYLISN